MREAGVSEHAPSKKHHSRSLAPASGEGARSPGGPSPSQAQRKEVAEATLQGTSCRQRRKLLCEAVGAMVITTDPVWAHLSERSQQNLSSS